MWCHLSAVSGFTVLPFGNLILPGILWIWKRESDPFIDDQGKESLNFQVSVMLYLAASVPLALVYIGILTFAVVFISAPILCLVAGLRARAGEVFRYPFTIRLFT